MYVCIYVSMCVCIYIYIYVCIYIYPDAYEHRQDLFGKSPFYIQQPCKVAASLRPHFCREKAALLCVYAYVSEESICIVHHNLARILCAICNKMYCLGSKSCRDSPQYVPNMHMRTHTYSLKKEDRVSKPRILSEQRPGASDFQLGFLHFSLVLDTLDIFFQNPFIFLYVFSYSLFFLTLDTLIRVCRNTSKKLVLFPSVRQP
jgi:hypothetical protein